MPMHTLSKTRVKICGNRTPQDISIAVSNGAHAIGLIVGATHFSEDSLTVEHASELLAHIPVFITSVLVTHLQSSADIMCIHEKVPATTLQLQDKVDLAEIKRIRAGKPDLKIIKAVHITDASSIDEAITYESSVDALLLDTMALDEDRIGGTGKTHDWSISKQIVSIVRCPVILAGGLTPENVTRAIEVTNPFAVDVNTGVDDVAGNKASDKVRNFIDRAMAVRRGLRDASRETDGFS